MKRVLDPIDVQFIDGDLWKLLDDFTYHFGAADGSTFVIVPVGFVTDFASIPPGAREIFPKSGPWCPAALVHDWLYRFPTILPRSTPVNRAFCDAAFREIMEVVGVTRWKRVSMYWAVRLGGWKTWNGYRAADH